MNTSRRVIHISDEQKNLYKALVDAYKSEKLILDTYGEIVSFKRRRDEEDKDEEPSNGSNRGSKRRRSGREPETTSAPKEKTSKTTGKSTEGKLTNLTIEEFLDFNVSLRMFTRSVVIQRRVEDLQLGVKSYQKKNASVTNVLERFYTLAGNLVKEILLKLNLPDHRIVKDGGEVKEFPRSFRHSDTKRLSRSDEVLKLKEFQERFNIKAFQASNQERYEHVSPVVVSSQEGKVYKMAK
ncbi:hypothetical protein Tco_0608415 [Tanacetum coccineum]